jgi:hypothetical protein
MKFDPMPFLPSEAGLQHTMVSIIVTVGKLAHQTN